MPNGTVRVIKNLGLYSEEMVANLLRNIKINVNQTNNEGLNAFWIAC
jgi:hypothetical protein